MTDKEVEGKVLVAQCIFDMKTKLGLGPLQRAYILATFFKQELDEAMFDKGLIGD